MAHAVLIVLHNLVRWIVLLTLLWALYRVYRGRLEQRTWANADRISTLVFTISLDVQMLLGLVLAVIVGYADFGRLMIDHITPMFIAVVFAHLGSVLTKKAVTDEQKFRRATIWFTLILVVILIAIPWSSPLVRLF